MNSDVFLDEYFDTFISKWKTDCCHGGPIVSHLFLNELNGRQLVNPGQQSIILEKTESLSYFLPFNNIQSANPSFQWLIALTNSSILIFKICITNFVCLSGIIEINMWHSVKNCKKHDILSCLLHFARIYLKIDKWKSQMN